ncbi:MAG: class I SAM-dependent methyltransferase [Chloroflexota bacterium]|nr:class I SAM-dependent methyltransferase [Chloroflexota bacterium]
MSSRPPHLTQARADRFSDQSVVDAYPLRWPYPPETFEVLVGLLVDRPGTVLDVGTGTGDIARPLVKHVGRVDAVDVSAPMLACARSLPGGDHPGLRWFESRLEDFQSDSEYALVTAGESLHWMDWDIVLPRFCEWLEPEGMLAIIQRSEAPVPWQDGLVGLIVTYSTVRNYEAFDLIAELEERRLFEVRGRHKTAPVHFRQPVAKYIESFHSRSSLSRENMPPGAVDAFDRDLGALVGPWTDDGKVLLQTMADMVWGEPLAG